VAVEGFVVEVQVVDQTMEMMSVRDSRGSNRGSDSADLKLKLGTFEIHHRFGMARFWEEEEEDDDLRG